MPLGLGCAGYAQWMLPTWLPGSQQLEMHMDVAKSGLVNSVTNSLSALIAPEGAVGSTGAVMNTVNNLIGTTAPIVTGFIVQFTGSFTVAFIVAGAMLVIGLFFYIVALGRIEQIPTAEEAAAKKAALKV